MKIPDINIIENGVWHNSKRRSKSSARFVLSYELEYRHNVSGESIVNDVVYPAGNDLIFFCRPGDIRYSRFDENTTVEIEFFYFVLTSEKNSVFEEMLNNIPVCIHADENTTHMWEDLKNSFGGHSDTVSEMQGALKLLLFLTHLSQKGDGSRNSAIHSSQQQAIFEAIRYMNEHLTETLSVAEIARHIGYSQSRFNSIFKEFTKRTPHSYFVSLKITEAKYMLLNTDKSISDISEALAFNKVSKFSSAFKKECHVTPGQFRKNRTALYYD